MYTFGELWFDYILFSKFINKLLELFSAVIMMQVSRLVLFVEMYF